jgi:DNA repair protein SbcD/Mre11
MRILHTADWHIGKKLHGIDLADDLEHFFQWLAQLIKEERVDILLISGDVFDYSNPSNEAKTQYYQMLKRLIGLQCKVIVTGGNHDSPQELNAPKALLELLDIHVVGRLTEDRKELLIPIKTATGEEVLIAAVPFIRDADLRSSVSQDTYAERQEEVRQGIATIYAELSSLAQQHYPAMPAIAMGHLFAVGVNVSESEREIQVGNLAGVDASHFGDYFHYVALGHIHKPQRVGQSDIIQYSGSPISLSFSEREDRKRVILLELAADTLKTIRSIDVPKIRHLKHIEGDLATIKHKLEKAQTDAEHALLPSLLEVHLKEKKRDPQLIADFQKLCNESRTEKLIIAKQRAEFEEKQADIEQLLTENQAHEVWNVAKVFSMLVDSKEYQDEDKALILEAFQELYQEALQQGGEQ